MKIQELLTERIYAEKDNLVITIQSTKDSSTKEEISTFVRRQPYETNLKGSGGSVVYSIFNYLSSPEATKLLSSIKGKGPYKVNPKQLDTFLIQTALASKSIIEKLKPDVIIYPKSSSTLVADFAKKIGEKHDIKIINDAFFKKVLNPEDIEPLINTSHPDWEKFSSEHPGEVKKLKMSLSKMIKDHGGNLELKKMYKPYMKFIKNFIEMQDAYEILEAVIEKNVLVLDDVLSSGSTMLEMIRQIAEMEPKSIAGLTIFKHTSQSST
jgi:hypothetical protein